ncbi:hypothetical protein [Halomonas shantousis]
MITKEAIDLARKAPGLHSHHQADTGPEATALRAIGSEIAKLAQLNGQMDAEEAIDQAVARYSGVGLDRDLAEQAYRSAAR